MLSSLLSTVSEVRKLKCLHVFPLPVYMSFQLPLFTGNSYYRVGYLKESSGCPHLSPTYTPVSRSAAAVRSPGPGHRL